jgi:Tol biopolymer transport system component
LRGKILFKTTRPDGKYPSAFHFYVMDPDGTNLQLVPQEAGATLYQQQVSNAGYSPDRSFLVIGEATCGGGHCDLYIAPPELAVTRSQGQWTSGPAFSRADQPVWSPDGNWVAFTWNLTNDRTKNIFKGMPFEQNQNFKRLTDFGGQPDLKSPTYSPDGSLLAFASNSQGNRWQIWVLNALAENFTDASPHPLLVSEYDDWDPVWIK